MKPLVEYMNAVTAHEHGLITKKDLKAIKLQTLKSLGLYEQFDRNGNRRQSKPYFVDFIQEQHADDRPWWSLRSEKPV